MGNTKIMIIFGSDTYSPMEVIDIILEKLSMKKDDWVTPLKLRFDPLIEILKYTALDYKGREKESPYERYWEELKRETMPPKCIGCECGEMHLGDRGWEYVCELEECYKDEEK